MPTRPHGAKNLDGLASKRDAASALWRAAINSGPQNIAPSCGKTGSQHGLHRRGAVHTYYETAAVFGALGAGGPGPRRPELLLAAGVGVRTCCQVGRVELTGAVVEQALGTSAQGLLMLVGKR